VHIDTATDVRQLLRRSIGLNLRYRTAVTEELSVASVWVTRRLVFVHSDSVAAI
jgi:hypothetical protein